MIVLFRILILHWRLTRLSPRSVAGCVGDPRRSTGRPWGRLLPDGSDGTGGSGWHCAGTRRKEIQVNNQSSVPILQIWLSGFVGECRIGFAVVSTFVDFYHWFVSENVKSYFWNKLICQSMQVHFERFSILLIILFVMYCTVQVFWKLFEYVNLSVCHIVCCAMVAILYCATFHIISVSHVTKICDKNDIFLFIIDWIHIFYYFVVFYLVVVYEYIFLYYETFHLPSSNNTATLNLSFMLLEIISGEQRK